MDKKFIFGITIAILLLMPLASASILSWFGDLLGITGKVTTQSIEPFTCTKIIDISSSDPEGNFFDKGDGVWIAVSSGVGAHERGVHLASLWFPSNTYTVYGTERGVLAISATPYMGCFKLAEQIITIKCVEEGVEKTVDVYLPEVDLPFQGQAWFYVASDGSTYWANSGNSPAVPSTLCTEGNLEQIAIDMLCLKGEVAGSKKCTQSSDFLPDMSGSEAMVPEHLARAASAEEIYCGDGICEAGEEGCVDDCVGTHAWAGGPLQCRVYINGPDGIDYLRMLLITDDETRKYTTLHLWDDADGVRGNEIAATSAIELIPAAHQDWGDWGWINNYRGIPLYYGWHEGKISVNTPLIGYFWVGVTQSQAGLSVLNTGITNDGDASTYAADESGYKFENWDCIYKLGVEIPTELPEPACADSDGGREYHMIGTVEWGADHSATDYCGAAGVLTEFYCDEGIGVATHYTCQYGCQDGACLKTTTETISVTLVEGEETTITMAGIDYRINLLTVSSSTTATISVDGALKDVSRGSIYSFADLQVYVEDIFYTTKAGQLSSVDIKISVEALPMPEPLPEPVPIPVPGICSELLLEYDLGDYKYSYSRGSTEVPVYSEKGTEIGMVQCCSAHYSDLDDMSSSALVCPYENKEDLENSLSQFIVAIERVVLGEYKGQKAYWIPNRRDSEEVILWAHDKYLLAVNRDLVEREEQDIGTLLLPEAIVDAYFERYPSDLGAVCIDSDGGKDYYRKGTVYSIDEGGNEYKNEDSCIGIRLMEHYCEMDKPASEYFLCSEGCRDGTCIRKECEEITGWRIENGKCVSDSDCDYDDLKYVYYPSLEKCQKHLECTPEWECKLTPPFCPPSGKQTKICKDVKCGTGKREKEISCPAGQCSGCLHDTTCVPYGHRLKVKDISAYCSIDSVFRPQMPEGAACENDYECLTNECSSGKCISSYSLLQKIWELLKAIFGKGWLWGE